MTSQFRNARQSARTRRSRTRRAQFEFLEDRLAPATFSPLPGTADGAAGSLRAEIIAANFNCDASNTINLAKGTYTLSKAARGEHARDSRRPPAFP